MQLVNSLEQQNAVKTLYSEFVSPVCAKYGLTRIELDILLFLANNTRYDTATDIVEVRFLAKSQVSAAIKNLEARGCLRREYQLENRKTAHLRLCDPAQPMIAAGRSAQEQFGAALLDGFTPEVAGIIPCLTKSAKLCFKYQKIQRHMFCYFFFLSSL